MSPPPPPLSSCESRCAAFPWFLVTPAGYELRHATIYEGRAQSASQSATNGDSFGSDSMSITKSLGFHGAAPGGIRLPFSPPLLPPSSSLVGGQGGGEALGVWVCTCLALGLV